MIQHALTLGWFAFLSLVTITAASICHPQRATCPPGMYLSTGVRAVDGPLGGRGSFSCAFPPGSPDWSGTGPDRGASYPGDLRGRIYCTGGSHPIVVNERTVGCQR